jgi:hypothetical protein
MRHALLLSALFAFGAGGSAVAQQAEAPRAVMELFTSQGSSACPPADRIATELARGERTLVLTLPVDYWDYLGWKDTLANPANTARQKAYARARGDRKVYTPQVVVNGREAVVGGAGPAVIGALDRAGDAGMPLPVAVSYADGVIEVSVSAPRAPIAEKRAEVWLFAVERSRSVQIEGGENAGESVAYVNVVRHMTRLGAWDGAPARFDIAADEAMRPGADGVAVLVQVGTGGQPGPILGAAQADIARPTAATTASRTVREQF